ncbi:acyltransferase family protein [Sphingomonas yantingensis]|uniref:Exopolysaccharide production protein ExoZ n=1 Tax=Sphingomonas yantingensis TaxID=1241761 RepID=A0A7W9ASY2_9SPHN|nr:acyltransferase [Sphingomonas yantingensis]MBB5699784.1 exopolysaccharide production protein ExoZ [Sphingomonas yantingensis]
MGRTEPPARLMGLQQLRAIAALGVVAFHAGEMGGVPFIPGAFGVDLFFVLSGFMMVAITDENSRPTPFLFARIRRVVPLYWLATLVMATGLAVAGMAPGAGRIASALAFLPQGNAGPTAMGLPLLAPGWSLHYEMSFYLLFAATLMLPVRWRTPLLSALLLTLAAIGSAQRSAWTSPILIEFAAGMWIGEVWRGRATMRAVAMGGGLCLIFMLALHAGLMDRIRFFAGTLTIAAMVWTLSREPVTRRPRLEALGDASYAIYLTHLLVMKPLFALTAGAVPPAALMLPAAILGIAASLIVHRRVERPIARALDPARIRARSRAGTSRPSVRATP